MKPIPFIYFMIITDFVVASLLARNNQYPIWVKEQSHMILHLNF